jgi:hypothetical protein
VYLSASLGTVLGLWSSNISEADWKNVLEKFKVKRRDKTHVCVFRVFVCVVCCVESKGMYGSMGESGEVRVRARASTAQ